ncbi:hypothetical protein ABMB68_007068 [Bradyrhizobium sp. RT4a]
MVIGESAREFLRPLLKAYLLASDLLKQRFRGRFVLEPMNAASCRILNSSQEEIYVLNAVHYRLRLEFFLPTDDVHNHLPYAKRGDLIVCEKAHSVPQLLRGNLLSFGANVNCTSLQSSPVVVVGAHRPGLVRFGVSSGLLHYARTCLARTSPPAASPACRPYRGNGALARSAAAMIICDGSWRP